MTDDGHFRKLISMMDFAPFVAGFDCRFRVERGFGEVAFEVARRHYHGAGAVHGAVIFFALDNAAMLAANSLVTDVVVFTNNFATYISRPVQEGDLRAEAKVVHAASSHLLVEAIAFDGKGASVARGTGTFMRSRIALNAAIGYA